MDGGGGTVPFDPLDRLWWRSWVTTVTSVIEFRNPFLVRFRPVPRRLPYNLSFHSTTWRWSKPTMISHFINHQIQASFFAGLYARPT